MTFLWVTHYLRALLNRDLTKFYTSPQRFCSATREVCASWANSRIVKKAPLQNLTFRFFSTENKNAPETFEDRTGHTEISRNWWDFIDTTCWKLNRRNESYTHTIKRKLIGNKDNRKKVFNNLRHSSKVRKRLDVRCEAEKSTRNDLNKGQHFLLHYQKAVEEELFQLITDQQ